MKEVWILFSIAPDSDKVVIGVYDEILTARHELKKYKKVNAHIKYYLEYWEVNV